MTKVEHFAMRKSAFLGVISRDIISSCLVSLVFVFF